MTVILGTTLAAGTFEVHLEVAITNPASTLMTASFAFASLTKPASSGGVVIDSMSSGIGLQAVAGSLMAVSLVPSSSIVGDTTTLVVSLKATHFIPVGGVIQVTFPKWNPSAPTSQI